MTDDESEDDEDEDARWKSKLKRPRMAMVADEVQSKAAAKSRLFSTMKRSASVRSRDVVYSVVIYFHDCYIHGK